MYKQAERKSPLQRRVNHPDTLQQKKEQNRTTQNQQEHSHSIFAEPLQQKAVAPPMTMERLQQNTTLQLQSNGEAEENALQAKFKWDEGVHQRVEAEAGDTPNNNHTKPNTLQAKFKNFLGVLQGKFSRQSESTNEANSQTKTPVTLQAKLNASSNLLQNLSTDHHQTETYLQAKFKNAATQPIQRMVEEEDEEEENLLQGKFKQLTNIVQRQDINGAEQDPLQAKFSQNPIQKQEEEAKPNNTGLPNNLKSGIENLSGYSMDDVKVHYNSSKPAQLQAHAYAQGTDIHIGPGQEKHLPHEAWHVVQQKQGRVKPTMQLKGVQVNDDVGLEREADVMGAKAREIGVLNHKSNEEASKKYTSSVIQRIRFEGRHVIQLVRLDVSYQVISAAKERYGSNQALGFITYYEEIVIPWLNNVIIDHPHASQAARNALLIGQSDITFESAYNEGNKFTSWDSVIELINAVNEKIDYTPVEFDITKINIDESELKEEITDNEDSNLPEPELEISSEGSDLALNLENLISKQDKSTRTNFINENAGALKSDLNILKEKAEKTDNHDELLQIHRFIGTLEFNFLLNNKNTKKAASLLKEKITEKQKVIHEGLEKLEEWELIEPIIKKGELKDLRHGADSNSANQLSLERFLQTAAELVLMKPTLQQVLKLCSSSKIITNETQSIEILITKILEGTVRRFKVMSILVLLKELTDEEDKLFYYLENSRIEKIALNGLSEAMAMAVSGEGHRAKEQRKMLAGLLQHLELNPEDVCIEYEPTTGEANYDIRMIDNEENSKILEVESIPFKDRHRAYEYYKQQYEHKLESITSAEDATIYIVIPPATKLPASEIEKIKDDKMLLISNIDSIEPIQLKLKAHFADQTTDLEVVQREIKINDISKDLKELTDTLLTKLISYDEAIVKTVVNYMDKNNMSFDNDDQLETLADTMAAHSHNLASIQSKEVASLEEDDFDLMTQETINNITPEQHKKLSPNQIKWFNQAISEKGYKGLIEKKPMTEEQTQIGNNKENTTIYTGENEFYHEKQKGGWCGKHALNAFLGHGRYSEADLIKLAKEHYGDGVTQKEQKWTNHITKESENPEKIGALSTEFVIWLLERNTELSISSYQLQDLSPERLVSLANQKERMIIAGNPQTLYPGEKIHTSGHYATARKDDNGNWWVINSTAAEQVQMHPKDYSKALEIILEVSAEDFKEDMETAAMSLREITDYTYTDWTDEATRTKIGKWVFSYKNSREKYKKLTEEYSSTDEDFLAKLNELYEKAIKTELFSDDGWKTVYNKLIATQEDYVNFQNLIKQELATSNQSDNKADVTV